MTVLDSMSATTSRAEGQEGNLAVAAQGGESSVTASISWQQTAGAVTLCMMGDSLSRWQRSMFNLKWHCFALIISWPFTPVCQKYCMFYHPYIYIGRSWGPAAHLSFCVIDQQNLQISGAVVGLEKGFRSLILRSSQSDAGLCQVVHPQILFFFWWQSCSHVSAGIL